MRGIYQISTGELIQATSASGDDMLINNAVNAGYTADDLELRDIDDLEAELVRLSPQPSIEQIRSEKQDAIKAERDRRAQIGGYKVGEKWFHSDMFSRSQQLGLVLLGANVPAGTLWKTMDGSFVLMTQELASQIFAAAAASDIALFAAAEAHLAALEASDDPANYDFSTGWPATFQDQP